MAYFLCKKTQNLPLRQAVLASFEGWLCSVTKTDEHRKSKERLLLTIPVPSAGEPSAHCKAYGVATDSERLSGLWLMSTGRKDGMGLFRNINITNSAFNISCTLMGTASSMKKTRPETAPNALQGLEMLGDELAAFARDHCSTEKERICVIRGLKKV